MPERTVFLVPTVLATVVLAAIAAGLAARAGAEDAPRDVVLVGTPPPTGLAPPRAVPSSGVSVVLTTRAPAAGESFSAFAGLFEPGERVSVWDFIGDDKVSYVAGTAASADGLLELFHPLAASTPTGVHVFCVRGEASGLVACARYAVRATGG